MKIIDLPCELGKKLYWVKKDCVWECEFWGIQYYYGTHDKEPTMYINIPAIKHPLMCIDGNTGAVSFDGCWTENLQQTKLSNIGENIFLDFDEAKEVLSERVKNNIKTN